MPQGNGSPVDVQLLMGYASLQHPRQRHRGKCFIDLEQVDVIDAQPGLGQHLAGGSNRPGQHQGRVGANRGESANARTRLEPKFFRRVGIHQQQRGSTIGDLRRIACGDAPGLGAEAGLERRQLFPRGIPANGFIATQHASRLGQ
ncbi:hypothetical protein D3C72_1962680 [compost metagenome]